MLNTPQLWEANLLRSQRIVVIAIQNIQLTWTVVRILHNVLINEIQIWISELYETPAFGTGAITASFHLSGISPLSYLVQQYSTVLVSSECRSVPFFICWLAYYDARRVQTYLLRTWMIFDHSIGSSFWKRWLKSFALLRRISRHTYCIRNMCFEGSRHASFTPIPVKLQIGTICHRS